MAASCGAGREPDFAKPARSSPAEARGVPIPSPLGVLEQQRPAGVRPSGLTLSTPFTPTLRRPCHPTAPEAKRTVLTLTWRQAGGVVGRELAQGPPVSRRLGHKLQTGKLALTSNKRWMGDSAMADQSQLSLQCSETRLGSSLPPNR